MKTLVLCRHAKSDWPEGVADIHRPLKDRGHRDAGFLGKLLAKKQFLPDRIISSPARRALSTAEIIGKNLGYKQDILVQPSVYYEGTSSLISFIKDLPRELETVMIFGHNPTFENAVRFILQSDAPFIMPTSAMACLEIEGYSWMGIEESNKVSLRWFLVPRLKRKN